MSQNLGSPPCHTMSHFVDPFRPPLTCDVIYGYPLRRRIFEEQYIVIMQAKHYQLLGYSAGLMVYFCLLLNQQLSGYCKDGLVVGTAPPCLPHDLPHFLSLLLGIIPAKQSWCVWNNLLPSQNTSSSVIMLVFLLGQLIGHYISTMYRQPENIRGFVCTSQCKFPPPSLHFMPCDISISYCYYIVTIYLLYGTTALKEL